MIMNLYLGIDIGSVSTDAVLLDGQKTLCAYSIVKSGFDHQIAVQEVTTYAENQKLRRSKSDEPLQPATAGATYPAHIKRSQKSPVTLWARIFYPLISVL